MQQGYRYNEDQEATTIFYNCIELTELTPKNWASRMSKCFNSIQYQRASVSIDNNQ